MDVGTATYIRLKIIHNKENQLNLNTVNINSHDETSKLYYPSNSNSRFTNQLPVRLLQGSSKRWTIKLISLCMPRLDFNVYPDFRYIKVKILDKIKDMLEEFLINIPQKNYKSLVLFKKAVNSEILAVIKNHQTNVLESKFCIDIQDSDKSRLALFNKFDNKEVSLGLNSTLAFMLGIKNNVQIEEGITNGINEADLSPTWGEFSKDLVWVHVDKNTSLDLPYLANLNAGKIKHAKIQCNEIDPLFFGGKH